MNDNNLKSVKVLGDLEGTTKRIHINFSNGFYYTGVMIRTPFKEIPESLLDRKIMSIREDDDTIYCTVRAKWKRG